MMHPVDPFDQAMSTSLRLGQALGIRISCTESGGLEIDGISLKA